MFLLVFYVVKTEAHPDGATPYWYPSSFIYGYVVGCADSGELNQAPFTREMWPDQRRRVFWCVVDSHRHSLTYQEIIDNSSVATTQMIVNATFPICIREELSK